MGNTAPVFTAGVSAENADISTSFVPQYLFTTLNHSAASSKMTVTTFCPHGACVSFTDSQNKQGLLAVL